MSDNEHSPHASTSRLPRISSSSTASHASTPTDRPQRTQFLTPTKARLRWIPKVYVVVEKRRRQLYSFVVSNYGNCQSFRMWILFQITSAGNLFSLRTHKEAEYYRHSSLSCCVHSWFIFCSAHTHIRVLCVLKLLSINHDCVIFLVIGGGGVVLPS